MDIYLIFILQKKMKCKFEICGSFIFVLVKMQYINELRITRTSVNLDFIAKSSYSL